MTSNVTDMYDAQQYLDYVDNMKSAQKAFADALQSWRDGASEQPASLWSREAVPPREIVETTFGFVERLVAAQKQFAIAFVDTRVSEAA
ncbi:MAG TPA: hypothetical protein VGO39_00360 [Gaiellaceae bacterium]|jgi:hypothetical protein|nr:hypothetical protein [Gaiellaceae bacterium]